MAFGVTSKGFILKRLADILEEVTQELSLVSDDVTGETLQPDFNSSDPVMELIKIPLGGNSNTWEALQIAFDQFNPDNATSANLDTLLQFTGLKRIAGTKSQVLLNFTGTPLGVIDSGLQVSDAAASVIWTLPAGFTFDGVGVATGKLAEPSTIGEIPAAIGTLTRIISSASDVISVNNPVSATLGTNLETDTEARRRRDISTEANAAGPAESVFSSIIALSGVKFCRVYINSTSSVDARGLTAKSQAVLVEGGDNAAIGLQILTRSGAGVLFYDGSGAIGGNPTPETAQISDLQGEIYDVNFLRPELIPIFVKVDIAITDLSLFPTNGSELIKQAIVDYSLVGASALGIQSGFDQSGFVPGEDVLATRLMTAVNSVPGHFVTLLKVGISAPATADTIAIGDFQQSTFDITDITVVVAP